MCHSGPARSPRRRKVPFWDKFSTTLLWSPSKRSNVEAMSKGLRVHFAFIYFVLIAVNSSLAQQQSHSDTASTQRGNEETKSRGLFSPRMQYDEWTPLGRGDPLKNDPTFDYMPPVLERVQYWMPPAARTPDPPRSTSSTASPPVVFDRRYQELPVGGQHQQQRIRQQYVPVYYQAQRPYHHHYHHHHHNNHHPPAPQTVLVPPPAPGKSAHHQNNLQYQANSILPSTTSGVVGNNDLWETQLATVAAPSTTQSNQQSHQAHSRDTVSKHQVDITPSPSILHYILHSELASVQSHSPVSSTMPSSPPPSPPPPQSVVFPSFTPSSVATTTTGTMFLSSTMETSTVPNRITTTSNPSLTTDPLFSHYKQPEKPIKGPMYLIIQGHSKVKTYGPAKLDKISGIPVQESNDISSDNNARYERSTR